MPVFNYRPLPFTGVMLDVDAVDDVDAESIVGVGNFDAAYGFVETGLDLGQQASAVSILSTSWISGGEITIASATEIDIAEGFGQTVDYTDPLEPVITSIPFGPFTNVAITDILTTNSTKISIDVVASIPTVLQSPTENNSELNRTAVRLGFVTHPAGTLALQFDAPLASRESYQQLIDYMQCLGVANCGGMDVNGNADLTIQKSAGEISVPGVGINSGDVRENVSIINAANPQSFSTRLGIQDIVSAVGQTLIDPANWDDGSATPTAIPAPPATSTIQYIYQIPEPENGVIVMYGQTLYANLDDAILNSEVDEVEVPQSLVDKSLLIARIALRQDATDLSDDAQAVFLPGAKFGTSITGGSSGGGGGGGDFFGPASSVTGNLVEFTDTTGKQGSDSGILAADVVTGPAVSVDNELAAFDSTTGKLLKNSGILSTHTGATPLSVTRYVDAGTTAVSRNGSIAKPYNSIGEALSDITDNTALKRYTLKVAKDDTFSFNPKPYISIIGDSKDAVFVGTLDFQNVPGDYLLENLVVSSITQLNLLDTMLINLKNCRIQGNSTIFATTLTNAIQKFTDCVFTADLDIRSMPAEFTRCEFQNINIIHSNIEYYAWLFDSCVFKAALTASGSSFGSVCTFFDCNWFFGSSFSTAWAMDVQADSRSFPFVGAANTSIIKRPSESILVNYDNSGTAITADNVQDAITELDIRARSQISGRTTENLGSIALSGLNQTITVGAFNFYNVNGSPVAAPFAAGIYTVPAGESGTYLFHVKGFVENGTTTDNVRFWVSKNNANFLINPNDTIWKQMLSGESIGLSGILSLNAGDTIRIKYSVGSGTGWQADFFYWDLARIG